MTAKVMIQKWGNSTFAHMVSSFILMGGWAFFANMSHPLPSPIYAGLLQGLLSAIITLGLKKAFEFLFHYWARRGRAKLGLIVTPPSICTLSASSLLICHFLAGTPELLATIIVPSGTALFYGYVYCYFMYRRAD